MHVTIYSDASHSPDHKIAACGYFIIRDGHHIKHEVVLCELPTSSQAEVYAIVLALEWVKENLGGPMTHLTIKTDHQAIVLGNKNRRQFKELKELIAHFQSQGTKTHLRYVKGHAGSEYNNIVDISVRAALRSHLKQK